MKYFQLKSALSKASLDVLLPHFKRQELKTDRYLLKAGQIEDKYYFVESGSIRKYFIHKEKEYVVWIQMDGDLFTEIKSWRTKQPTHYYFQAIEPTVYWSINATEFEKLIEQHAELQNFMRQFWEVKFITALDGFDVFQTMTAKERYDYLIKTFPRLHKLPLQHLAAVLGITQSSLSRIRRMK